MAGVKGKSGGRRVGSGRKSTNFKIELTDAQRQVIEDYKKFMGDNDLLVGLHLITLLQMDLEDKKKFAKGFDTWAEFIESFGMINSLKGIE